MHNHTLWNVFLLGHIEVVKLLASHGAEVACKDKRSYTPLHAAASSGMISVVKYLLDLGVDVSHLHTPPFHNTKDMIMARHDKSHVKYNIVWI